MTLNRQKQHKQRENNND